MPAKCSSRRLDAPRPQRLASPCPRASRAIGAPRQSGGAGRLDHAATTARIRPARTAVIALITGPMASPASAAARGSCRSARPGARRSRASRCPDARQRAGAPGPPAASFTKSRRVVHATSQTVMRPKCDHCSQLCPRITVQAREARQETLPYQPRLHLYFDPASKARRRTACRRPPRARTAGRRPCRSAARSSRWPSCVCHSGLPFAGS